MSSKHRFGILLVIIASICSFGLSEKSLSQEQILDLVNQDRAKMGLTQLSINETLNLAALAHAEDMLSKKYFAHVSPVGATPWSWFKSMGYNYAYAGENLAEGYTDAVDLERSWMSSPSHRANILSPNYSDVGVAIVSYRNTSLVVQMFGSKDQKLTLNK